MLQTNEYIYVNEYISKYMLFYIFSIFEVNEENSTNRNVTKVSLWIVRIYSG